MTARAEQAPPPLRALIHAVPDTVPFVGPETLQRARGGQPFRARLGANENGFGPSPKALLAVGEAVPSLWKYADPSSHDLIDAIAAHERVDASNIVVGEGIDGLLGLTVHLMADPGAAIVTSDGAYPTFNFHAACHGAKLIKVPYRDDHEDIEALVAAAHREAAVIIYLANPDNPMGTWWSRADIEAIAARLPASTLLCLDEAYVDTLPPADRPIIDPNDPRVVRFRTFSKAYGLAGARIGYAIGVASLIQAYEKVRNHYGINRLGQIAALAAVQDQAYLAAVVARIERAKARIAAMGIAVGLTPITSAAAFVALDCGRDGTYARSILDGLLARDVFARKPAVAPLDRCIRISAGPDADLDVLEAALAESVAAAQDS